MRFFYSYIINPLFFTISHIVSIFNVKFRNAIIPRYQILKKVKEWKTQQKEEKKLVLIHTSSMGEFEHIKYLLKKLAQYDVNIVITFFSPSGYEHIKSYPGVSLFLYTPFDFQFIWRKIYAILEPSFIVFAKHETWPNYVWTAEKLNIPLYLINAALPSESSRFEPLIRRFYRQVYRSFTTIFAISKYHLDNFNKYYPQCHTKYVGDSKFDQVLDRKTSTMGEKYIAEEWLEDSISIVLGSIHQEDSNVIFPALIKLMNEYNTVKLIIVPHDLHSSYLDEITKYFSSYDTILYSNIDKLATQRIIIVDKMGILADIYRYGDISFVGGSFKEGIHNVMEPAIYGSPIVHGPKHKIAHEAGLLNNYGGSSIIVSSEQAHTVFKDLICDKKLREEVGNKAQSFSLQNTGTADKLIQHWKKYLL